MKPVFTIFKLTLFISSLMVSIILTAEQNNIEFLEKIEEKINHAETYYWFGMAEQGNMDAYDKGLAYLLQAAELLHQTQSTPEFKNNLAKEINALKSNKYLKLQVQKQGFDTDISKVVLSSDIQDKLLLKISALRQDISEQAELAHDTFYGIFPLVRLIKPSLFQDAKANLTYELVDDNDVIATTSAGETLVEQVIDKWGRIPQMDVVFSSTPHNPALENELLYIFNNSPKFFVHNFKELTHILSKAELESFKAGDISPRILKKIFQNFQNKHLLIVQCRQLDNVNGDYFCLVQAKMYQDGPQQAIHTNLLSVFGFTRDRTNCLATLIYLNIAFFLFAVALSAIIIRCRSNTGEGDVYKSIPSIVLAYGLGRIFPWIVIPLLASIMPLPENLAKLSFWWPLALGGALILGPAVIYKIVLNRLHNFFPFLKIDGKGDAVFVAVALGMCAYISGPLLVTLGLSPIFFIIICLFSIAACVANYIMGRTLDANDTYPALMVLPVILISLLAGIAICMLSPIGLVVVVSLSCAVLFGRESFEQKTTDIPVKETPKKPVLPKNGPTSFADLQQNLRSPVFVSSIRNNELNQIEKICKEKGPYIIKIEGNSGLGKTALIKQFKDQAIDDFTFLYGECVENSSPYKVFIAMLAGHFNINLHIPSHIEGGFLEKAAEHAIPMLDMFLPPADTESRKSSCLAEFHMAVFNVLKNKIIGNEQQQKPAVLIIDGYQWIDEASKDLLNFLLKKISDENIDIKIVLITQNKISLNQELNIKSIDIPVTLTHSALQTILASGLNMSEEITGHISERISGDCHNYGGIRLLFQYIEEILNLKLIEFDATQSQFTWTTPNPPELKSILPEDYTENIKNKLNDMPEYEDVLKCAACIGYEFETKTLACILNIPELTVIKQLDELETNTGMINDNKEVDGIYKFASQALLQSIRAIYSISFQHMAMTPQYILTLHKSIATLYEQDYAKLPETAKQYFAAGSSCAEKAFSFSLKAALSAKTQYAFQDALIFIEMAEKCAKTQEQKEIVNVERIKMVCEKAHVIGGKDECHKALKAVEKYLNQQPEVKDWTICHCRKNSLRCKTIFTNRKFF